MHRDCPPHFQEAIDRSFGTNKYGGPLYKLAWGQTETMRAGGYWQHSGFKGYKNILAAGGSPCWCIFMWEPSSKFGSPALWYYLHRDEVTGLQDLGKYPHHGRYRLIHKLMHREMVDGRLVTEAMELNAMIISAILPMVKAWQSLAPEKAVSYLQFDQASREMDIARAAAEAKASYAPAFRGGAVSYTGQGCRTSLIAKKEEFLQKNWNRLMRAASKFNKGMQQVKA